MKDLVISSIIISPLFLSNNIYKKYNERHTMPLLLENPLPRAVRFGFPTTLLTFKELDNTFHVWVFFVKILQF